MSEITNCKTGIERLLQVMKRLRDPEHGCPWDKEQTFATIAPYTIEEAYEVADAIAREDWPDLKGELGDLLFQVVFYAQMASEQHWYDFDAIAHAMADKLERRHPHVFAEGEYQSHEQLHQDWEKRKAAEREQRAQKRQQETVSLMDDIPLALPALMRAQKIQKRAASVGFDWPDVDGVFEKIHEELAELQQAMANQSAEEIEEELGDLLYSVVNLARHLGVKSETALANSNDKFVRRFQDMERTAAQKDRSLSEMNADALEQLWQQAKRNA
ncbi:nucleoside triphosphate pyrophosphohydrolase [Permianibacter aggregans]|uniref:Nucleoside triphosphate pyrophosphohydrolase n=1 Tax=Permianibacter aggregans TaxID=1510150 RepID=A0A4R6UTQ5_9GAMM|nr:nucleoside triphosphate pyrophosphohydrolase [Permianibacter aggregans]QGX38824.1 nucleoside triphosphate pyrophosphohydrolase [Permianibacter aggregans]TDQ50630.1 ATP diphosphatase [Permianibacter aggregans]